MHRSQGWKKNIEVKMTYVLSFQLFKNMRRMEIFVCASFFVHSFSILLYRSIQVVVDDGQAFQTAAVAA